MQRHAVSISVRRRSGLRTATLAAWVIAAGCVPPSNPFDPGTPVDQQAKARIVGNVVIAGRDFDTRPVALTVKDDTGAPLRDASGNVATFSTRASDAPLPDGLEAGRPGAAYEIPDLLPGTYSVVFDAAANQEPFFLDAETAPAALTAGAVAVRSVVPGARDPNLVTGEVHGEIEGADSGVSFIVRLIPEAVDGIRNRDLEQLAFLSDNGAFTFRHVPAGRYRVEASGDNYAPASTAFFTVQNEAFNLPDPVHLTTLGRIFALDDFSGHDGLPPFAPFLPASPAHVAIAPVVLTDPALVAYARVFFDETRPAPADGWEVLSGAADVLTADFDSTTGDGPRTALAQLRLCFGSCICPELAPDGDCADPTFEPPLVSREIELPFVVDTTPPRAVTLQVDDSIRTVFADDLEAAPAVVPVSCARFGDAECALAGQDTAQPSVSGDVVDDTSRVVGFRITVDDAAPPTSFTPILTLSQLARISGLADPIAKATAIRTLRVWAQDAAGNIGEVDVRTLNVDVDPLTLNVPALLTEGTLLRGPDVFAPGASILLDINAAGELPARWRVRNEGPAQARGLVVEQTIPYTGKQSVAVDGNHLQPLLLFVDAFDAVGNVTRTQAPVTVLLSRASVLQGTVALENRADASGAALTLTNAAGTALFTVNAGETATVNTGSLEDVVATFALSGAFSVTGLPVASSGGEPSEVYTVDVTGPAPFGAAHTAVEVRPPGPTAVDPITLRLPRGSLVGRFVLEGRESASTNSGIQVTIQNQLGVDVGGVATFANGTWRVDDLPVGTGYKAIGFFDGYIQEEVPGIEVVADVASVVLDDGSAQPTAVVLKALSGDFRLCAPGPVLDIACAPVVTTNLSDVQVGGISFDSIGAYRVATAPFGEADPTPAYVDVAPLGPDTYAAPAVTLGPSEGRITVYLQLRSTGGIPGPVLTSQIVFDQTPPSAVSVTLARGTDALADGFTRDTTVRARVSAQAGTGDVAALKEARVVFAGAAPGAIPAQTACPHDTACAVPLEDNAEGIHTAWAWSCDQAGNCSAAPVSTRIVVDRTPPQQTHGTAFVPKADYIVPSGGQLFSRSAQFNIAVQTGTARTAADAAVVDLAGDGVADVFGVQFGLNLLVDDGTFASIPAPAPTPAQERIVPGLALPPVDGTYTIYAQFTDAAGNKSELENNAFHVDLVLDTRGPSLTFALDGGATVTRNPTVTLDVNDASADRAVLAWLNQDGQFVDDDASTYEARDLPLLDNTYALNAPPAPAGDGSYTVYLRAFDRAGNATERSASIFLDRTAPVPLVVECVSCTPFDGADYTRAASKQVVLATLAQDNSGVVSTTRTTVTSGALSGLPTEVPFSGSATVTLQVLSGGLPVSPDGAYAVLVEFIDEAGNVSSTTTLPVTLDLQKPVPALSINGGALYTNDASVALTLAVTDATSPVAGIRLQNTTSAFSGAVSPFSPSVAWTLAAPGTDENKLVFLEATDAAGNVEVTSAQITLDRTPPSGTVTIAAGAARTSTATVNVALAYNVSDANAYAITVTDPGFPSSCQGVTFTNGSPPATTQVTFAGTGGEPEVRTVYVCTRDRAGNTALAFDTIVLDEDKPTGSITVNGGAAYSTSRTLSVAVAAPPDTVQMKSQLSGPGSITALDCAAAAGYVAYAPTLTLSIGALQAAGLYTAQVCLKDSAGNVTVDSTGTPAPLVDQIVFDAAAPTISVLVNGGAAFTTQANVTVTITASDDLSAPLGGIASMRLANTTPTFSGAGEAFQTTRSTTVAAATTEGSKTVCVELTDAAGRTANACDDIVLDLSPPAGTVTVARATGNFSLDSDAALSTTFRSTDATIAGIAFAQAPLDCAAVASFQALAVNTDLVTDVAVAPGEGTRSVTGCFRAQSGLITAVTDTVYVDPVDPPLAQPIGPAPGSFSASKRPVFSWAAVNAAATYTLVVRRVDTQVVVLTQTNIAGLSFTPVADLPETQLEWAVRAVKPSGRTSALSFTGAPRVTVDATAPTAATSLVVAVHAGRTLITSPAPCLVSKPCANDANPTLSFTPGTDVIDSAVLQLVEVSLNGDFTSPILTLARVDGSAFDIPIGLGDGSYRWRVRTFDDAGNSTTSATSDFLIDRTAPLPPTFVPPRDPVSQAVESGINITWSSEASTGAVNYAFELTTDVAGFGSPILSITTASTQRDVDGILQTGPAMRHLVRVASIDALGNRSAFSGTTFVHDSVSPCSTGAAVALVGTDAANTYTDASVVTIGLTCTGDAPATMRVACDGTLDTEPATSFAPSAACVLPTGQGSRSVQLRVLDQAGNQTALLSDSIIVDTAAPTTPVLLTADTVTNLAVFPVVVEDPSFDTNFSHHEYIDGVNVVDFTPFVGGTVNILLGPTNRTHNVRVRGVDLAGNTSPEALVKITYDDTSPTAPVVLNEGTTSYVNSDTYTFTLRTGSLDANFETYETASCPGTGCTPGGFTPNPGNGTFTFAITANQSTTFSVRARDRAGNVSTASSITVVEDSANPRPVVLQPLPDVMVGGAPPTIPGYSRGPYVDVLFARTETNIAAAQIDPNFDHFEVRGSTDAFLGFVPMCETPTATCQIPFATDNGFTINQPDHLIKAGNTIVGFRVPMRRSRLNTIVVRSVDKAGNVSLEGTVTTTDITDQRLTNDVTNEIGYTVFGDKVAYFDDGDSSVHVHETGRDMQFGTADDTDTNIGLASAVNAGLFFPPIRVTAMGPNLVLNVFNNGGTNIIQARTGGTDGLFSTFPNSIITPVNNDGVGSAVDETKEAREPSFWDKRAVWREFVSSSDTDVVVREAGTDGIWGNGDDRFARVANDSAHQLHPVVSGENIAFFKCSSAIESQCGVNSPLTLTIVNSGADKLFGTGDDVINDMTRATNIASTRIALYTPGTANRPACRNVVAYAGLAGNKGVFVIAAGPEGIFDPTDEPVQVAQSDAGGSGDIRWFSLYDTLLTTNDGFAPPYTEVITAGKDGCFTRTADNQAFDLGLDANSAEVFQNVIVTTVFQPTIDMTWTEIGAERALWTRNEGQGSFANQEVDRDGVAMGNGGYYDFNRHAMVGSFVGNDKVMAFGANVGHHDWSGQFVSFFLRGSGTDELFGTGDDTDLLLSGTHMLAANQNIIQENGVSFAVDENVVVWAAQQPAGSNVIPVVRTGGADGVLNGVSDCELEMNAALPGYSDVDVTGKRISYRECSDVYCSSEGNIIAREGSGDFCSGSGFANTTLASGKMAKLEGESIAYLHSGEPHIVVAGSDHRFSGTADNIDRIFFNASSVGAGVQTILGASGDRVVWTDARSGVERVVVGDLGDMSTRTLTRSTRVDKAPSIDGDVVVYATSTDEFFTRDSRMYYFGVQPDLAQDATAPAPSRLRCPSDDPFEENDSNLTATPMNSGAMVNAIVCTGDQDRYALFVPRGCTVRARAHFAHVDGDIDIQLLDSNDVAVAFSSGTSDNEAMSLAVSADETFQLLVYGFNNASNTYDASIGYSCP